MKFAARMDRLGTETAFEVLVRARKLEAEGRDIVHLEIGQPDFPTPPHVVEAGIKALRDGHTGYTPAPGLVEIREAVAEHVTKTIGIEATPDEVVVTPGAKPIIKLYAFLAFVEEGDEVVYPNPGFPIYESMLDFVGARRVPLALTAKNGFRVDVDELERLVTDRTKLLILNSPANPTGGIVPKSDLPRIAEICRRHDVVVLSDEIYSRILFSGRHASIAAEDGMRERTIVLDGFSKAYSMTGWRLGYGVMPKPWAARFSQLMVNSNSCTANFVQRADRGASGHAGP